LVFDGFSGDVFEGILDVDGGLGRGFVVLDVAVFLAPLGGLGIGDLH
jgi:hypothetical protein